MGNLESYLLYFLTFSFSVFASYLYSKIASMHCVKNKQSILVSAVLRFICISAVFMPLIVLYTCRYNVGVDYASYKVDYEWYSGLDFKDVSGGYLEIGYGFINILAYKLFNSYQGLLLINALLTLVPAIYALIKFDVRRLPMGLFVYLFTLFPSSFNGMRQHIAVSFVMLGIVMLYKKKWVKYVICIIIGCLFHKTSIVAFLFLILVLFKKKNLNFKFSYMVVLIVVCILLIGPLMYISSKLPIISFYYNKYIDTKDMYSLTHYIVHTIFRLPIVFLLIIYHKKILKKNKNNLFIIMLPFIDFIFIFMSRVIRWAIRMTYFTMAGVPFAVMLLESNDEISATNKRIANIIIILTLVVRFIAIFGFAEYDGILPYRFIFFQ